MEVGVTQPGVSPPSIAAAAGQTPFEPVMLPVVVVPPVLAPPAIGLAGGGAGAPAGPRGPAASAGPKSVIAQPRAGRPAAPAGLGANNAVPPTFRVGYVEYLRTAGMSQILALAVPGTAGILALTGIGGLVGYRQAKAGRTVRARGLARFMN